MCRFHPQIEENKTKTFHFITDKKNPCNNVVCQNGGTCKLVFNSTNAVQSRCSCRFGFYGAFCEKCNYIHYVVNHLYILLCIRVFLPI